MFRASPLVYGRSQGTLTTAWRELQRKKRFGLQDLKALYISFNPTHPDSATTKEFARRVTSRNAWLSNRTLDLDIKYTTTETKPEIKAVFPNNDVFYLDTTLPMEEMVDYFNILRDKYVALMEIEKEFPNPIEEHPFSKAGLEEEERQRRGK